MGSKGSKYTENELATIKVMAQQGATYSEIAKTLGREAKHAARSIGKIVRENGWKKSTTLPIRKTDIVREKIKRMQEMSREERTTHIEGKLLTSRRFQKLNDIFTPEYVEMFKEEYFDILRTTDDLNEAEEQMLFEAIKAKILSYVALERERMQHELYDKYVRGELTDAEKENYVPAITDKHTKDYTDRNNEYIKLMDKLKMSRDKRVNELRKQEHTFTDVVAKLMSEENRRSIAAEILDWERKSDEELQRLFSAGYISGDFND